jgi:hypothetical protein
MMKKTVKLYNVMMPIWLMLLFPTYLWLLILPVNFLIDSLVVAITTRVRRIEPTRRVWQASILLVWIFGFISDFIGAGLTLLMELLFGSYLNLDTIHFPGLTLISIPGVLLAGVLIYVFNRYVSFRRSGLKTEDVKALALTLAIATAPYTMLIPVLL